MFEYYFSVNTDDDKGVPFGPVNKDNMDVSRLLVDFTGWLDVSESITTVDHLMIKADPPQIAPPWQANYPLDETSSIVVPVDTYPLAFYRSTLAQAGKVVVLDMAGGTPGLTYAVSFVATAGVSQRKRVVDTLMVIDRPLNPDMVALADILPTYVYPLFINVSTNLPLGFKGRVYIQNTSNAPINVTLPPSPNIGDVVSFVDILYTNGVYPASFVGHATSPWVIDYGLSTGWTSFMPGDDVKFEWNGAYWSLGSNLLAVVGSFPV